MDDPNKSKLFAFGKIENNEDSDSEESLSDSTDEDPVAKDQGRTSWLPKAASDNIKFKQGKEISTNPNENNQDFIKETERLNFRDTRPKFLKSNSSDASSTDSNCVYNWRRYDGSDKDAAQQRPRYGAYPERRNLFGSGQRVTGNWTLRCDGQETNSDGLTEADIAWEAVTELCQKESGIFTFNPNKTTSRDGCVYINCKTADHRDEESILKVANLLRENVYFPYVMYYHSTDWKSNKSNSLYMHTPNGEFYKKGENNCWILLDKE